MTDPMFTTRKEALAAGWFSRRHRTSEPHRESVSAWRKTHGKAARKRRADARAAA